MAGSMSLQTHYYRFKPPSTWQVGEYRSPVLALNKLGFCLKVTLHENEKRTKKRMGVFLECVRNDTEKVAAGVNFWSCNIMEGKFRVHGVNETHTLHTHIYVEKYIKPCILTNNNPTRGFPNMLNWEDVVGPKFLVGDHIQLEVQVRVELSVRTSLDSDGKAYLSYDFLALYESGEGTDIVLKSKDGHEFPCHQLVLSARSPVFKAMFQHDMKEKAEGVVNVDMGGKSLSLLCNYVYSGNIGGAENDTKEADELSVWKELFRAGDMYELQHLCKMAAHALVLRKKPENAWGIMTLLKESGEEKFADSLEVIKQFIIDNVKEIVGK